MSNKKELKCGFYLSPDGMEILEVRVYRKYYFPGIISHSEIWQIREEGHMLYADWVCEEKFDDWIYLGEI